MRMIVSRASDEFMERDVRRNYAPCKGAIWNEEIFHWCIEINSLDKLVGMAKGDSVRLIICQDDRGLPHITLDDLVECWQK